MKEQPTQTETEVYEEVLIGKQNVKLSIPANVIRQAQSASAENKNKLAGYWSAQIIKGNPQMMHASLSDPVAIWFEVKNVILKKFNRSSNTNCYDDFNIKPCINDFGKNNTRKTL